MFNQMKNGLMLFVIVVSSGWTVPSMADQAEALRKAADSGDLATVQVLLVQGAKVNAKDHYGRTALMAASEGGHRKVVQLLLAKGAKINAKDHYGRTALMAASGRGHREVMQLLLDKGAEVDAEDHYGRTALMAAFEGGHREVVQLLLPKSRSVFIEPPASASPNIASPNIRQQQIQQIQQIFYEVKVFYATDRMQSNKGVNSLNNFYSGGRNEAGTLDFGVTRVSIPHDHKMGYLERPVWWKLEFQENPVKHVALLGIEIFDESKFKNELRQQMEEMSLRSALVFVHGYNTTFQDGILRIAQIAYDLQFPGVPILYSWPSNGETDKYIADEANTEWTTPHFKAFLTLVLAETGAQTVHVIAHSMGNRALINALRDFDVKGLPPNAASLHNVVFAAPDFDAGTFTELAQQFKDKADRVTLYASSNDEALKYSSKIHGYPRAGYSGDDIVVINGIDTIDASAVATDFIGHAYYGERRSIISDIFHLIKNDLPPKRRHGLEQKMKNGKQYWALVP